MCTAAAWGQQWSLNLDGTRQAAQGATQGAPTVDSLRIEFRMHNFQLNRPVGQQVLVVCSQYLSIRANEAAMLLVDFLNNGESMVVDLSGRTDIIFRIQHFPREASVLYEMWNGDGTKYASRRVPGRRSAARCENELVQFGSNGRNEGWLKGAFAYFRWFNTTVAPQAPPSLNAEGAILAYEFEQNGDEVSGNGRRLTVAGGASYIQTPVYPPVLSVIPERTLQDGETLTLEGSEFGASSLPIVSWRWEQIRGPLEVTIDTPDQPQTTVTGATKAGTYEFRLTATNSANVSSSVITRVGVVPTNESGVVLVEDPNVSFLLGPMVKQGKSPWPWFDNTRLNFGRQWAASYPDGPPGELDNRAGTVAANRQDRVVRGTGTKFVSDFIGDTTQEAGRINVAAGTPEIRGAGTAFTRLFLKDQKQGTGIITIENGSAIVTGESTSFPATVKAGQYLLARVQIGGLFGTELRAFRIKRVLDAASLELETAHTGGNITRVDFQVASDAGKQMVITDGSGKRWVAAPSVVSDTVMRLPEPFRGASVTDSAYSTVAGNYAYSILVAHYTLPGSDKKGRQTYGVTQVISDTELRVWEPWTHASGEAVAFGRAKGEDIEYWVEGLNYYDSVLVHYQNYYRTGLDTHRDAARKLADLWWTHLDEGRGFVQPSAAPRQISLTGLMLRAMDGRPEMWPAIKRYVDFMYTVWLGLRLNYDSIYYGVRESGFMLYYCALMAKVHPDEAVRSDYQAKALEAATQFFIRLQWPDGSWRWTDDLWRGKGEQPFHVGLLLEGMIATHRLTRDDRVLQSIQKSLDHLMLIHEPAPCRKPVYAIYNDDGPWGQHCANGNTTVDRDTILDGRAGNNTIIHAYGYAYAVTGKAEYKTMGDDMFAATFGAGQGPGADQYWGRADTSAKQYGQSFRSSGSYLAYRLHSAEAPAIPDF
jgi:hypothetical protein